MVALGSGNLNNVKTTKATRVSNDEGLDRSVLPSWKYPEFPEVLGVVGNIEVETFSQGGNLELKSYPKEEVYDQSPPAIPILPSPLGHNITRGFTKDRAPGKLTSCERDLAINGPAVLVFSSYVLSLKKN